MSFDADALYSLLPAVYRIHDAEQGGPLRQWVDVIAGQVAVLEDHLEQLYDNQFVETASPWALPYIADLLGLRGLSGRPALTLNPRAEVGHTIAYRRRKGTAAMLELLARDVTGWPARAVEIFKGLATTQNVNHVRLDNQAFIDLRKTHGLELIGTPFESAARTVEVRRIEPGLGQWNIPNVGLFLWRLKACSMTGSPLAPALIGGVPSRTHYRFHPLGLNTPLFSRPESEDDISHLAEPINVPLPLTKRWLRGEPVSAAAFPDHRPGFHPSTAYYAKGKSLFLELTPSEPGDPPTAIPAEQVVLCDLPDVPKDVRDSKEVIGWLHEDEGAANHWVLLDPQLGRVVFPQAQDRPPVATFHYGFIADLGGGEYGREDSFLVRTPRLVAQVPKVVANPLSFVQLDEAINAVLPTLPDKEPKTGLVEILDSGRYEMKLQKLDMAEGHLEIRAADGRRPLVFLTPPDPPPDTSPEITGKEAGEVSLNGLLLAGAAMEVTGGLGHWRFRHCTLATPLIVNSPGTQVEFENCLLRPVKAGRDVRVRFRNCLIDAYGEGNLALRDDYANNGPSQWILENCTVIGRVDVGTIELASNTIFLGDEVKVQRRQEGCVRFCWLPTGACVPRRYRCLPSLDAPNVRPAFTSLRLGDPAYGQLSQGCPEVIRRGADDGSEMGAFHDGFQPQREEYLRTRLKEYLRFGLEAGIIYVT